MDRKTASYHTANPQGKHSKPCWLEGTEFHPQHVGYRVTSRANSQPIGSQKATEDEFWGIVDSKSQGGSQASWVGLEGLLLGCCVN